MIAIQRTATILLILTLTTLLFFQVRYFAFVNWDDQLQVVNNEDIRSLSPTSLFRMFSSFYAGMYQPLTTLSFAVDYIFYDISIPGGYHITSLMLHLLNVFLLFILLRGLKCGFWLSVVPALIFAVHPVQVEAVTWISARSTLLFTAFYMMALISYIRYILNRRNRFLLFSFFAFAFSLLSKPSAASFFLFIPVVEYLLLDRMTRRTIYRSLLFAIPGAAILIITYFSRGDSGILSFPIEGNENSLFQNIVFALWSVVLYMQKIILPLSQNVFHLYPRFTVFMLLLPVIFAGVLVFLFFRLKQHRKMMILTVALFLIPLSVHLKFIPFGDQLMADRYAYLSVPSLFIFPVYLFLNQYEKHRKKILMTAALVFIAFIVGVFSVLTTKYQKTWQNDIELWSHVIERNPGYYQGYYNRGAAFSEKGKLHDAIADYSKVTELKPGFAEAYMARGVLYSRQHDYNKAISDYNTVLQMQPDYHYALFNKANANYYLGNFTLALSGYREFRRHEPEHEDAAFFIILSMIQLDYPADELLAELDMFTERFSHKKEGFYLRGLVRLQIDPDLACIDLHHAASMGSEEAKFLALKYCFGF
jgi:protein O-mannosyl-transferase